MRKIRSFLCVKKGTAFASNSFHGNKCQKPKSCVFALIKVGSWFDIIVFKQILYRDKEAYDNRPHHDADKDCFQCRIVVVLQLITLCTLFVSVVYRTEILIVVDASNVLLPPLEDC